MAIVKVVLHDLKIIIDYNAKDFCLKNFGIRGSKKKTLHLVYKDFDVVDIVFY